MTPGLIWLLLLATTPDGGRVCKAPSPEMQVKVSFKSGATVDDLARFASAILCEPWAASAAARKRTLQISVEGEIPARQLPALFRLLTDSATLERAAAPRPAPAPAPTAAAPGCSPSLLARIVPVDSWTRKIPVSAKDQLVQCLPTQARVVPELEAGTPKGFKLFGIRQGSVGEALAFQNGDLVLAVNGSALSTVEQALQAWGKLQAATELKFAIVRKGEPRTITWQLR